jgi:galactitol-specific phosphotransferase system IIB component
MAGVDKISIEQLDVDNYGTWSVRMRYLLLHKGLWTSVTEDEPRDDGADQKALALIGLSVKDHHLSTLAECKTSKEAWDALAGVYKAKSNAKRLQLKRELNALKKDPAEPLTKYVGRAKDIRDQLRAAGYAVKDEEVALSTLAGLPDEYDIIVTMLENTDETLDMDDMLAKLLTVEQRMATKLDEKALFTGAGGQQRHGEVRSVDQRECFYCGKKGHIKRDCHQKMRDDEERSRQARRATGEHAEQANLMLGVRSGRYEQAASGRGDEWGVHAMALSARTELANIVEQGSWVLDSGATNHITNDYKRLINVRKTDDGTVITMANGRKEIVSAVGDVVLSELDGLKLDRIILKDVLCVPMAEYNLLSVACAVSKGANFEFGAESCKVSKGNVVIAEARVHNGIYCLRA